MIKLQPMTRAMAHRFFRKFQADPDVFADNQVFLPYAYTQDGCNAYFDRQKALNRVHLAIMLEGEPIGEIILKNIDHQLGHCRLSIHMQSDAVKNKGYGTAAEKLALEYAFSELRMNIVFADALAKNRRSRHVLQKAGFRPILENEQYCYYSCSKPGYSQAAPSNHL